MERLGSWLVAYYVGVSDPEPLFTALKADKLRCCNLIRGEMVCSRLHLGVAIERLVTTANSRLRNAPPLLVALSPKPSAAIKIFGFTGEAAQGSVCDEAGTDYAFGRTLVVAMLDPDPDEIQLLTHTITGRLVSLDELGAHLDMISLKSAYGVTDAELKVASLNSCIVSRLAVSDI